MAQKQFNANIPRPLPPEKEEDTVFVGCKLPNGLNLDLRKTGEPPRRFTIRGLNAANAPSGGNPALLVNGAVMSRVPKKFFEEWLQQHRFLPAVVNGFIFHHTQEKSVAAQAKDMEKEIHGLEPMDQTSAGIKPLEEEAA